jgi:DNA (cytosine-5)-methyltransferase 1
MVSRLDAVDVTLARVGMKRDAGGRLKFKTKHKPGHEQQTARGSVNIHSNGGRSGRSASRKLQGRQALSARTLPMSSAPSSATRKIKSPRITVPYKMHSYRKIKVGSDCSGWASAIHALRLLGLGKAIDHRFACDISEASKTFIFNNCRPKVWYPDCLARDNSAKSTPSVDIYVAGFPCEPYSAAGNDKGMHDSRADVFSGILDYIRQQQPTIYVLENVKHIGSKGQTAVVDHILRQLRSIRDSSNNVLYTIHCQAYNSLDFGVPQHRDRVYFVGIRRSAITKRMRNASFFKHVLSSRKPMQPIGQLLGSGKYCRGDIEFLIELDLSASSFSETAKRNLREAMDGVNAASLDPSKADIVVDLSDGRGRVNMVNVCPTITSTRAVCEDFYLISNGRLSFFDFFLLQGLDPYNQIEYGELRSSQLGHLAGKAMTIPVLAAVLRAALLFTGLACDI